MNYRYRKGDKVFFKVIVGASSVPLEKDEVIKLTKALGEGKEGLMVFRMGIVKLDKINGIVPDTDRMQDFVDGNSYDLPNIGKRMIEEAEGTLLLES